MPYHTLNSLKCAIDFLDLKPCFFGATSGVLGQQLFEQFAKTCAIWVIS